MNTDLPALPEPAITPAMVAAYLAANTEYWRRIDAEPGKLGVWRNGTPAEATEYSLRAALAAQQPAAVPNAHDIRTIVQQAYIALEELQGPGFLIGGVMHYRIGLILPKLNDAINALAAAPAVQPELTGEDTAEHVAYRRGFQHGGDMARAAAQQPARGREADRARFPDPAFNEWLDTTVTENGEFTVWHLLASTGDALAGWENRPHYVKEQPAEAVAPKPEKTAPVQGWPQGIPWSLHLEAYAAYCKKWSPQPALIDLEDRNCRGGFSTEELDEFIPGWRDKVSEIGRLKAEVARLSAALAQAEQPAEQAQPVAWCCLTENGQIAYFDGRPMVMTGPVGNEHHTTPLVVAAPPATPQQAVALDEDRLRRVADELFDHQRIGDKLDGLGRDAFRELAGSLIAAYAAAPTQAAPLVALTEKQIDAMWDAEKDRSADMSLQRQWLRFARAVERAHGIEERQMVSPSLRP